MYSFESIKLSNEQLLYNTILWLRVSVPSYQKYIDAKEKTCDGSNIIGNAFTGVEKSKCETRCNEDPKCMFFFYNVNKRCALFASCDDLGETDNTGTTFAKGMFISWCK